MAKTESITQDRLKELLDYNPETGVFTWKVRRNGRVRAGDVAGTANNNGYTIISIDCVRHLAHRLAYLYVHGCLPEKIDHRNTIRTDNWIDNLRPASGSQNKANSGIPSKNTSGYKGVCFHAKAGKWRAKITVNRRSLSLGLFSDILDAAEAYKAAAILHFGEFARLS
jgi:hypothetical protein